MVAKLLVFLAKEKNNYKVSACFFENTYLVPTNSKDCSESRIRIRGPAVLPCLWLILRFSPELDFKNILWGKEPSRKKNWVYRTE
jgi:hypothetical protein